MTNLDNILKSRDITLSTKIRLVKAMVFNILSRLAITFKLYGNKNLINLKTLLYQQCKTCTINEWDYFIPTLFPTDRIAR